jgi:hypothetical protein
MIHPWMASAEGEAMNISDIILAMVALALIANAIALVRHWRLMREAQIALDNLAMSQRQFNKLLENEQQKQRNDQSNQAAIHRRT